MMGSVTEVVAVDYSQVEKELRKTCPRGVRVDEPMSKHTTIGAGGTVRFLAVPQNVSELVAVVRTALKYDVDYLAIGRGSNLLVRDGGFNGLAIKVANNLANLRLYKRTAYAEAGASFTRLGRILTRHGRPHFEFAIGIPGSVGGAVRMNAGAYGSELSRVLKSTKIITTDGRITILKPEQLAFRYRGSSLPRRAIVISSIFWCPPGEVDQAVLKQALSRKDTQPIADRSFGSTFKNPPGSFAAQMIDRCGLKGMRRGGAMISKKHANFVINVGDNTKVSDIESLMEFVIARVKDRFGVTLEPEVIIIGNP
ncbi:MAG: UDP-N-acetylmuramate dehydrogenase [Candidatus Krumholzibacteria bacterium]|nr:UDP-N-acetylmuramate dehydrogenase [Candidatus Krumholzibacteria bacterium]